MLFRKLILHQFIGFESICALFSLVSFLLLLLFSLVFLFIFTFLFRRIICAACFGWVDRLSLFGSCVRRLYFPVYTLLLFTQFNTHTHTYRFTQFTIPTDIVAVRKSKFFIKINFLRLRNPIFKEAVKTAYPYPIPITTCAHNYVSKIDDKIVCNIPIGIWMKLVLCSRCAKNCAHVSASYKSLCLFILFT